MLFPSQWAWLGRYEDNLGFGKIGPNTLKNTVEMRNNGGIGASGRNVVIAFINKNLFGLKAQCRLLEIG